MSGTYNDADYTPMGYFEPSHHAKSYKLSKGDYVCCDLANSVECESTKDIVGHSSLLTFHIENTIDKVDGYFGGKYHFTFPVVNHELVLVPQSLCEAFDWTIDKDCGIKFTFANKILCYETPDCIVIGTYTIYKRQSTQVDRDEIDAEEEDIVEEEHSVSDDNENQNDTRKDSNDDSNREVCPVCYGKEEYLMKYPCGHSVCFYCLREMIKTQHNRCPTCRRKMIDSQESIDDEFVETLQENTEIEVSSLEVDEQEWIADAYERLRAMTSREQRRYVYDLCVRMEGSCAMEDFRRNKRFGTFALRLGYVINQEDTR